jgi:hypothetical protein
MNDTKFYAFDANNDYVETTLRPSPDDPVFSTPKDGYKHNLGDGWHHIDDTCYVLLHGKWRMLHEDSTVPILYSVYKLFESLNCAKEFQQLCVDAGLDDFTPEEMAYGAKHSVKKKITIADLPLILDDLDDINYHNFANKLEAILGKYE